MAKTKIEEVEKRRFQFLYKLYEITNGDVSRCCSVLRIGQELNLAGVTPIFIIARYLAGEELIEFTESNIVKITHKGIVEVENVLSESDKFTKCPSPSNIIYVGGSIIGSQVQQANKGAKQAIASDGDKRKKLEEIVQFLKEPSNDLLLTLKQASKLQAEIKTIEAQILYLKPNNTIIIESLNIIASILGNAKGSLIASNLLAKIVPFLQ